MKRIVVALIAAGLIVPGFALAQDTPPAKTEKSKKKTPSKSKKGKAEPKKEAGK